MKKIPLMYAITVFLTVMLMSASLLQCKKEGDIIKNLDRTYTGSSDSTVYSSFYEQNAVATALLLIVMAVPSVQDLTAMPI